MKIPFYRHHQSSNEIAYLSKALASEHCSADGSFTKQCAFWFKSNYQVPGAYMTHSCTAALEMSALLIQCKSGDEIIMPAFTHVSTANAFVLRGAKPVFADVLPDRLTIDPMDVAAKITSHTKAIVVVHYGGYSADVKKIKALCDQHGLFLIEDAAHGIMAKSNGSFLGTMGHFGCISFHDTKNIRSGEGGVLLINDPAFIPEAEIKYHMGTNRAAFLRKETNNYTWQSAGSSFAMNNLSAAMLLSQLEHAEMITQQRREIWNDYYKKLSSVNNHHLWSLPPMPENIQEFNAHIFFLHCSSNQSAMSLMNHLALANIDTRLHYQPLNASPAAIAFNPTPCPISKSVSETVVRLPLYANLSSHEIDYVVGEIMQWTNKNADLPNQR